MLGLGFRRVLVANDSAKSEFHHTSQHMGSNIRTAWVVADVFGEQFLTPVRSREARLNRHLRNGESPQRNNCIIDGRWGSRFSPSI